MLKVTNLRKEFDTVVAVDGVSLEVQRGELFGLLGPNGAGKTTTIRTVLNIIKPDGGEITFDGRLFTEETWNIIGYLPEERGLYRKSKILNVILYFAALKGMSEGTAKPIAYQWLERFGLKDSGHKKVEELSKGNQQKIQLIAALLHRPQLLILDEPFSGLDPVNQILLKDILMEIRQQNTAIIFSTHQMEQVEKMCDNICLINKGKIVLGGSLRDVKKQYGTNSVHLEFEGDGSFLRTLPFVRRADVYQNYAELELKDMGQARELLGKLDSKLSLRKFEIVEPSLHSIFINVVGIPKESEMQVQQPEIQSHKRDVQKDPRVRKSLFSLLIGVVVFLGFSVSELMKAEPSFIAPALILAAVGFAFYRYLQAKGQVTKEMNQGMKGPGR
ncbi:MAG: ATP-binding cassette domain-containing protein [Ignavibacteriales bacterium]|nr:ATP-binding cassette domain-containing protein [Ignavibacteriales bacterium]